MSNRHDATNWRSQLAGFVDVTDSNLRSMRKEPAPAPPPYPALPLGGRVPARQPEAVANARAELSTLLAAVQGSLADLRVEVAAAKRLSTNASAVVAGDMSPLAKPPNNRSSSVQPRPREHRTAADVTPPMQMRMSAAAPPYNLGQSFGSLFATPPGSEMLAVSPQAMVTATTPPASGTSTAGAPQNEELVKAIDQRLLELGHKIERSLERSMEEQSLRSQLQHAVQAANAMQQQQQMMLRSSAPSQGYAGFGAIAAAAANAAPDVATAAPTGGSSGGGGVSSSGGPSSSPSPLVILAMNKADAAEKLSSEVRSELQVLHKQAAKDTEDTEKRLSGLQDASRQHWEKMCQVSSQVDALLSQRSGSAELQGEVARVAGKLLQLEAGQDRTIASIDEHQRLMRQLTTALQKLTQEADSEHAISSSRHGELAAKLETAAARTGELEARVSRVGDVEARMARLGDVEAKLARLGELEARVARVADMEARVARVADMEARVARLPEMEARVARLADLEVKVARMGDVEAKITRMGDVEAKLNRLADVEARLGRLGDVETRLARLSDMEIKLARMGEVEAKLARLGDVESKLARMAEVEAKLARMGDMELRVARMGDVESKLARMGDIESKLSRMVDMEAKLARMGDVEARLGRLGDAEARLLHVGELESRVAALQASVAAATAVAANASANVSRSTPPPVVSSPPPGPDPITQEALRRVAALEQQVARLAAGEQSNQVQERDRRRGQAPPAFDSNRSHDGIPAALAGLFSEVIGSPASPRRGSTAPGARADGQQTKEVEERIKLLEDTVMQGGSFGQNSNSRTVQTLLARMERLEQIVRAENSIEAMAQEARLAVAEEFVLELRRDFHDVVGPTLEKLAAHVSELRKGQGQGSPDTGKVTSELRALSSRIDTLDAQVTHATGATSRSAPAGDAAASRDGSDIASAMQERLTVLEMQIKELNTAVEDNGSIFSRLQRHQTHLDRLQHEVEALRSSLAAEVAALKAQADSAGGAVGQMQADVDDTRDQLAALARLDDQLNGVSVAMESLTQRLGGQESKVGKLEQQQLEQQKTAETAVEGLSERLEGQEGKVAELEQQQLEQKEAVDVAVQALTERLGGQESKVASLEQQQLEQRQDQPKAAEAAVQTLVARLGGQEGMVEKLEKQQLEQRKAAEVAVQTLTERLGGQEGKVEKLEQQQKAAEVVAQGLAERLGGQEAKVSKLEQQQQEQQKTAVVGMKSLTERLGGHEDDLSKLKQQQQEQQKAAEAAAKTLTERLGGQEGKVAELEKQRKAADAAVKGLAQRLDEQEGKVADLAEEQQKAAEAASVATVAVVGAGALSRSRDLPSLPEPSAAEAASKAALEELETEVKAKIADLRGSVGDVRKELGGKVQALDAQTQELLAFREEILTSYVELQDGVERATGLADDALRRADGHDTKLQALSEQVDAQASAAEADVKTRSSAPAVPSVELAAVEVLQAKMLELQQRVSTSASEQEERLAALDAKVHALSELITAASQDSQAASEARSRAEDLTYELSQAQESLESLVLDSGRLAEQLAAVAASSNKTTEQLERVAEDVQGHGAAIGKLQDGLIQLENRVTALPATPAAGRQSLQTLPEVDDEDSDRLGDLSVTTARVDVTLPASRTGASQAIFNPLYSSSSEDIVFAGMNISSSGAAPSSSAALVAPSSQPPSAPTAVPQQAPMSPGPNSGSRPRGLEQLPPLRPPLSEEASVRDKALYYEQLASTKTAEGGLTRRSPANSAGASEGPSQESSALMGPLHGAPGSIAAEPSDPTNADPISPGAAAATAAGAVGLAGLRQAALVAGTSRSLPPTPTGAAAAALSQEPVIATGALAAVRAARSGLGLSGDLSSPKFGSPRTAPDSTEGDGDGAAGMSPVGGGQTVFGREQTFRRGVADEEVSISSGDEEGEPEAEGAGTALGMLGRERTFRRGAADEEVSLSSDEGEDDVGDVDGVAQPPPPQTRGLGPDDNDDDLELDGLAPPIPPPAGPKAAEPPAPAPEPQPEDAETDAKPADGCDESQASSDSGDIDEDIELEPGINPSGFDADDDDEAWPAAAAAPPSQANSGQVASEAASKATPPAAAAAPDAKSTPPSNDAPPVPAIPSAPTPPVAGDLGSTSHLSTSGALGGSPLAPLQLSSGAAAMFSASGDLGRRKLPPLSPLAPLPVSAGALGPNPALSTSRGLDLTPSLLRPVLGSLQNSGNLSGHLSGDLQASLGELPSIKTLSPLPPLQRSGAVLPPVGGGTTASPTAGAASDGSPLAPPASSTTAPAAAEREGPDAKRGEAVAESAGDPVSAELLAPAPVKLGQLQRARAIGLDAVLPGTLEPVSPLRSLLLAQPMPQPHPEENVDNESPMPALPGTHTDTSGSVPFLDTMGEVSGLSRETSAFNADPAARQTSGSGAGSLPGVQQAHSNRGLASLLDSDSDSFMGDHFAAAMAKQPSSGSTAGGEAGALATAEAVDLLAGRSSDKAQSQASGGLPLEGAAVGFPPGIAPLEPQFSLDSLVSPQGTSRSPSRRSAGLAELLAPPDVPSAAGATFFAGSPSAGLGRSQAISRSPDALPGPDLGPQQDLQTSGGVEAPPEDDDVAETVAEDVDEYDDDFDDAANSSAPRGTSPAVTGAPSAASLKVSRPLGDEDDEHDQELELPGVGVVGATMRGDAFSLGASDSLNSFDAAAPGLPAISSRGQPGSSLPPLPPGVRRTTDAPPLIAPTATASRASLLTSEDSLALIAPPEGAGGGLLEEGSEDDIFGDSTDPEAMGPTLDGGATADPSRSGSRLSMSGSVAPLPPPTQRGRGRDSAPGSKGDVGRVRQSLEQGLSIEPSGGSLDFNGELSLEAERIAAMLTSERPSAAGAPDGSSVGGAPLAESRDEDFPLPTTGLRSIYAPRGDNTDLGGSLLSPSVVRSVYGGPSVAVAAPPGDPLVQGSLDFCDDPDESSSSSGDEAAAAAGAAMDAASDATAPRERGVAGRSGLSRTYSDSSMELEVFRPPAPHQQQQPTVPDAAAQAGGQVSSSSGESSASQGSLQRQRQEEMAVPAVPFGISEGDCSTSSGSYRLQVVTGKRTGAGCSQGIVRMTLYGSESTHVAQLRPPSRRNKYGIADDRADHEYFAEGSSDEFMVDTAGDLGDLSAVYIWHQGEGFGASWYVESITVEQLMTGLEWTFEVNNWVRGGKRGGRVVRLPGAALSISRENSLARLAGSGLAGSGLAGSGLAGSQPGSPPAGAAASGRPGTAGSGGAPQRRGMAAMGDESLDLSSDMNSPVGVSGGHAGGSGRSGRGSDNLPLGRHGSGLEVPSASASRLGGERSGGNATQTSSVNFSEADDEDELVPGLGGGAAGASEAAGSVFAGAAAAAKAAMGSTPRPRVASNVPSGIGLVLEEDIEEVDGMLSNSAAFSLGPVSARSGPAMVSPRPPLPPGAPRRRDFTDDLDEGSVDVGGSTSARRQALPPTPPLNRKNSGGTSFSGRRLSSSALEAESSHDSFSGIGGFGSRRRVRISGGGDDGDLASELSVEGSELSIASAASLSMYAPDGVRPPPLAGSAIGVDYMGTSRKRVSWAEYAEEFEFLGDHANSSGSVASMTEEDLLEAQGETVRPDASRVGYDDLMRGSAATGSKAAARGASAGAASGSGQAGREGGDGAGFTEVPLKQRRGQHANSYGYKIKIFTADKLNAGLGNTTVHLELLGREATVSQALPKDRGTFQRGCVDRFTLYSTAGDMGQLLALKVWHEGKTLGPGNWGFEQVVIDDRLKGNRYVFRNADPECVLRKGRRHCLVLKPAISRIDESEDLAEVAHEYETQLTANRDLSESERAGLRGKLDKINQRLSKLGSKIARSMSGGLGFK